MTQDFTPVLTLLVVVYAVKPIYLEVERVNSNKVYQLTSLEEVTLGSKLIRLTCHFRAQN